MKRQPMAVYRIRSLLTGKVSQMSLLPNQSTATSLHITDSQTTDSSSYILNSEVDLPVEEFMGNTFHRVNHLGHPVDTIQDNDFQDITIVKSSSEVAEDYGGCLSQDLSCKSILFCYCQA